jgi:hypothetical protein
MLHGALFSTSVPLAAGDKSNFLVDEKFPFMPYFGDFYIAEIESSHIAEYRKLRLQQKAKNHDNLVSPATVNREVILLKSMLKKAAE